MICPNVNAPNFICRAPVDPLHQRVFSYLQLGSSGLQDSVVQNVEWVRATSDAMVVVDELGGTWWLETVSEALGVTDSESDTVDRPGVATDALGISDSFVFAGTAGSHEGGIPEVPAIFDSETKKGMVVYVPSSGHADLAQADAAATARAVGLATADVAALAAGNYVTEGIVEQADWTLVTGAATLTPGVYYYLSESAAGKLTTTAPTTISQYVVAIGRALSTTQLDVEISQPILL